MSFIILILFSFSASIFSEHCHKMQFYVELLLLRKCIFTLNLSVTYIQYFFYFFVSLSFCWICFNGIVGKIYKMPLTAWTIQLLWILLENECKASEVRQFSWPRERFFSFNVLPIAIYTKCNWKIQSSCIFSFTWSISSGRKNRIVKNSKLKKEEKKWSNSCQVKMNFGDNIKSEGKKLRVHIQSLSP